MQFEAILIKSDILRFDISENTGAVDFTDNINAAGICTFGVAQDEDDEANPEVGNGLRLTCDGVTYFVGYIFKVARSHSKEFKVTAYDQLRYLKASETYVFKNRTASQILAQICSDFKLRAGLIEDTKHILPIMTFDAKVMLDMIAESVTNTLIATKKLFFVKDLAGEVVFKNIESCITDLKIAPDSLLFNYSYERSIDDDTFNQIKLVRDNKSTGQREIFMTRDSNTISSWGILQHYEKVDDGMNPEQIKQKADSLLFLKNRITQKFTVDVTGEKEIRAGNLIYIELPEANLSKYLLCLNANHRFTNTSHTVKATFKMV